MTDRKPTYPHRVQITREDGSQEIVTWEYADNPLVEGTPLSKANLLDDTTGALLLPEVEDPTVNQAFAVLGKKMKELSSVTVSLPASGWQGAKAPYTQQISVEGMTGEWNAGQPSVRTESGQSLEDKILLKEAMGRIDAIGSDEGVLTVTCFEDKPQVDMILEIPGVMGNE